MSHFQHKIGFFIHVLSIFRKPSQSPDVINFVKNNPTLMFLPDFIIYISLETTRHVEKNSQHVVTGLFLSLVSSQQQQHLLSTTVLYLQQSN